MGVLRPFFSPLPKKHKFWFVVEYQKFDQGQYNFTCFMFKRHNIMYEHVFAFVVGISEKQENNSNNKINISFFQHLARPCFVKKIIITCIFKLHKFTFLFYFFFARLTKNYDFTDKEQIYVHIHVHIYKFFIYLL